MADASLAMKEPPALADVKPPVQSKMEKEMGDLCGWNKKKRQKKLTMIESMNLGAKALALTRGARCRVIGLRNASRYNPPGHPVHESARTLLHHFERKLGQLLERLTSTGAAESPDAWLESYPLDAQGAPPGAGADRAPSVRARLLPELAGSVHRMKESLFVLYLQEGPADASSVIADPDAGLRRSCPLLDSRHTFLEMCQFWHYQFDALRRAKHSTIMLLYHLHAPQAESLGISCAACAREIRRVRWHCATCVDYNICRSCEREHGGAHRHALTPFRITFSRRRALAPEPARRDRPAVVGEMDDEDEAEEDEDA